MRNQKFGIEIEMTGLTRQRAAEIAAAHFGTNAYHSRGNTWAAKDSKRRVWSFVYDASIVSNRRDSEAVEMVSPICEYDDISTIQELIRKLRRAGAVSNTSCGIHIHIDASKHNANTLRNLTNIMASKQDMIYKALNVHSRREGTYCKKIDERFVKAVNEKKPQTMEELKKIWYNGRDGSSQHYHISRYHCLNLHSVFQKGTVEFRLFNADIKHAGKIKAYIQFCLAISNQALSQKSASPTPTRSTNERYTFRTWLLRLGFIGKEFETARLHLLANLEGNSAWKDPAQAEAQRQRLLQQQLPPQVA